MSQYTQADRPLRIFTPLGPDALLPVALEGHEGISELFQYRFDLLAEKSKPVAFEKLIGQEVRGELHLHDTVRRFHGIVTELSEGIGDDVFLQYRVTVSPTLWRLTRRLGCRIFQDQSVLDILKELLAELNVRFQMAGTYRPRNFCVQYYETDFAFVSRLMEEEGIFYYFEQGEEGHKLVVSDQSMAQADIAGASTVRFQSKKETLARAPRVTAWKKTQQLCSGKFTVWDYNFQLPDKHLEATFPIADRVTVGSVDHFLDCGDNQKLEIFQFTGGFGGHYDSIDRAGSEQDALRYLFEDNHKFARLRMEREASQSLRVEGAGTCAQFLPGQHFILAGAAAADGPYLLTRVEHQVRQSGYRSGEEIGVDYRNGFAAVPKEAPYRSPRVTPRPNAHSLQPAVVVGPKGEEIYTDKFGRVKVQFLWDREGKYDGDSSCWIRVAQAHAGKGFGFVSLPRVGEEVLVAFAGDNPDRPVIVGRVYNANNSPPFELPKERTRSGLRTHSVGGSAHQYSGLAIDDRPHQEHLEIHSERHLTQSSEGALLQWVGGEHQAVVGGSSTRVTGYPGALKNTPAQPAGSGAGGGTALTDTQTIFADADIQFGWVSDGVVGVQSEIWLGSHIETTINPIGGLASLFSQETPFSDQAVNWGAGANLGDGIGILEHFGSKFWIAFTSAHTEVTIGTHPQIQHGLALEYSRGPTVEGNKPTASTLSKVWGTLYSLVALTVDLAVPLAELWAINDQPLTPTTTTPSIQAHSVGQVFAKEGIAEVGKLVLDAMLAVWIGIEMKEQAGDVESVVATQEAAALRLEMEEASKLQAEALIKTAEEAQHNALKAQVKELLSRKEAAKIEEQITALRTATTKTCEGLYSVMAPSMLMSVKGKAKEVATLLRLEAMAPLDEPEQKASVKVWGDNLALLQTKGGAQVEVASGMLGDADLGQVVAQSGREGGVKLKMGEANPPHALMFHKDGVKIFSRDGGIHILHGASAKFEEFEAATAPRKIVVESRDAPVEIRADRILIKADLSIRLECGANFIELNESGIVQNGITTTTAADAAFMEMASIQLDTP